MAWASHIRGAISQLLADEYWQATQSDDAVQEIEKLWFALSEVGQAPMSVPVGVIVAFPTDAIPPGDWLKCDGSGYAEVDYPELALLINGVAGVGGFDLPNLNGRIPVGRNNTTVMVGSTGDLNTTADSTSIGYFGMVYWIKAG